MVKDTKSLEDKLIQYGIQIAKIEKDIEYIKKKADETAEIMLTMREHQVGQDISMAKIMGYGGAGGIITVILGFLIKSLFQ